jgi:hypothetical protein
MKLVIGMINSGNNSLTMKVQFNTLLGQVSELVEAYDVAQDLLTEKASEIERLQAERDTFYMDYRMKCDVEGKELLVKLATIIMDEYPETDERYVYAKEQL